MSSFQICSTVASLPRTVRMSATTATGRLVVSMSPAAMAPASAAAPSRRRASVAAASCRSVRSRSVTNAASSRQAFGSRDSAQAARASARAARSSPAASSNSRPVSPDIAPISRRQRIAARRSSGLAAASSAMADACGARLVTAKPPAIRRPSRRSAGEPPVASSEVAARATIGSINPESRLVRRASSVSSVLDRVCGSTASRSRAAATSGSLACPASRRTSSALGGRPRSGSSPTRARAAASGSSASIASRRFSTGRPQPAGESRNAATSAGCFSMAQRARNRSNSRS